MIRLVLFDIDGTLVHTGGAGVKAFRKVFAEEFGATDGFEKLKFAGRTDVSLVREFFKYHNIADTPENFARFF
jgi:phosphoglycolate phosphatase-like HAD superfamily hydrolase